MKKVGLLVLCLALTVGVGSLSGYLSSSEISTWYATLKKPSFNPPNSIFGPVWTVLYVLMGISFYLVLTTHSSKNKKRPAVILFIAQLVLNFFWSLIFFNLHQIGLALVEILALWLLIIIMIIVYYRINKLAALLQVPYLLWVSFATLLTAAIYSLNG